MSDTDRKNRDLSEEDIIDLDEIGQEIEAQATAMEYEETANIRKNSGKKAADVRRDGDNPDEDFGDGPDKGFDEGSDGGYHGRRKKKKKMKLWKKILLTLLTVIVILVVAGVAVAYGVFHHYYSMLNVVDPDDEVVETYTGEEDETDIGEDETDNSLSDEEVDEIDSQMEADQEELSKYIDGDTDDDEDTTQVSTVDTSNLYNILLIGVDSRSDNFSGRSDMIMLITINKSSKKVVITSILRDTYVSISGYKNNRINAAYAFGGASLLISTIKQNFGISVDDYVIVNFYSIVSMIDYIGGVDISVTAEEIPYINSYASSQISIMGYSDTTLLDPSVTGMVHMNGNLALAYGRVRYVGTDFARTERQRTVALAALNKVKTMSLSSLNSMAETFLPEVKTSLSESDCLSLMSMVLSIGDYSISTLTIPQSGTWSNATIRKMAVLTVDFTANYKAWLKAVQ